MHQHQKQLQEQARIISNIKTIKMIIQKKVFHLHIDECIHHLIYISLLQHVLKSSAIVQQSFYLYERLTNYILTSTHRQQQQRTNLMRANTYFCLAITSQIIKKGNAQRDYRLAHSYDQQNPSINLLFALFLYGKQKYLEAIKHQNKIKVQTAFQEQHRLNIFLILGVNVGYDFYSYLLKPKRSGRSEEQIVKTQFISSIIKFKQLFLYRCTQIQSLSQISYSQLAFLLYNSNRFEDGLTLTYKLRNLNDPPTQQIQQYLSQLFYAFNKCEDSVECAKQGLRINPLNQQMHQMMMKSLFSQNKYSLAKDCAFRLMDINKYNRHAYLWMGAILLKQGREQLGLQCCKLCVVIQPSEITFAILAISLQWNGRWLQAQGYFLKSIRIKPLELNYFLLGYLYLQSNAYLNAIHCFIQSIKQKYSELRSFFLLGICAKRNPLCRLIANKFMDNLQRDNPQKLAIQTNLGVYRFISEQSKEQMFGFMSKFVKEKNQGGEETLYSDIATNLFWGYAIRSKLSLEQLNVIFAIMMGIIGRAKEEYNETHKIYARLMNKYKQNKNLSASAALTQIYQTLIRKTPKCLHSSMLQFLVAETIQQNSDQGLKCFNKCLFYADGDYEQFYLQLYKKVEGDIEQLSFIDFVANSVQGQQYLSAEDYEMINHTMNRNVFGDLHNYILSLRTMAELLRNIKQFGIIENYKQAQQVLNSIKNGIILSLSFGWRAKEVQGAYFPLFIQIISEQKTLQQNINCLLKIYNKQGERKLLIKSITIILQEYFDKFAVNQKIKLIFNHFLPFIISQMGHREFAVILGKIKQYPNYCRKQLREDLHSMFKEGNRHNKVFKPQKIQQKEPREEGQESNETVSVTNSTLIDLISQTRSQWEKRDEESQFFEDYDYFTKQVHRRSFDQNIQDQSMTDEQEQRQIIEKISLKRQDLQKEPKIIFEKRKGSNYQSPEEQSNQEGELQKTYQSQFLFTQQSEVDSYLHQKQQARWFQLFYSPNKTNFFSNRLYSKFNEFLHLNTGFLLKYISKQSQTKYIAKHIIESNQIYPNHSFRVYVQKGDQVLLYKEMRGEGNEQRTLRWIKMMGPMHRFRWITDIALGISQLQDLGIYHAQIFFRNTIKITEGKQFYFKIIDFDKAFKVNQTEGKDKSLECTMNLFDFWLRFRFNGSKSRAPKYQFDFQSELSQRSQRSTFYDEKDIIEYIFMGAEQSLIQELITIKHQSILEARIDKCLKLLGDHMRVSHLKQYYALAQQLLEDSFYKQQLGYDPIQPQRASQLKEELQLLKEGKINYVQFAGKVKMIGGIQEQSEEDEEGDQQDD